MSGEPLTVEVCSACGAMAGQGAHGHGDDRAWEWRRVEYVPLVEAERLREALTRAEGTLTLWLNFAPVEVRTIRPGPNGKTLAELTRETFDIAALPADG